MVIKVIIDTRRSNCEGKYPLKIRFSETHKITYYSLGIYANQEDFNKKTGLLESFDTKNNRLFRSMNSIIVSELERAKAIQSLYIRDRKHLSVNRMKEEMTAVLKSDDKKLTFNEYYRTFLTLKKGRTLEIYLSTLRKIEVYAGNNLPFSSINKKWLAEFNDYMMNEKQYSTHKDPEKRRLLYDGLSINARAIHLRNIRAVINAAIDDDVISLDLYPFRGFKIKKEETVKRAIKITDLRALFAYKGTEHENWAIDIAKIIFFAIGINTKDLFYIERIDEFLNYKRFKTSRLYNIPIELELEFLIEKYKGLNGLNFKEKMKLHTSFYRKVNENFNTICEKIGIPKITTYSLRHTWATIASKLDIPKETISQALGHGKKTVTDIYIDFDESKIKTANRKVINYVLQIGEFEPKNEQ